jgi:uncharacterized coiled-coil DUF342 family protein
MYKNPRIAELLLPLKDTLEQERDAILAKVAPLKAQREVLVARIQLLEAELKVVDDQIVALEQPKLREIGNELAAIARQLGAITMKNEGGVQ